MSIEKKSKKIENVLFGRKLKSKLDEWKRPRDGDRRTVKEFAGLCGVEPVTVNKWMSGDLSAKNKIDKICEVLGVEPSFFGSTYEEKYKYDEHFTQGVHDGLKLLCNQLGLDNSFLKFVHNVVPDEEYPVTAQIVYKKDSLGNITFKRDESFLEAFDCGVTNEYQRRLKDGKTINLRSSDLAFLYSVQEKVEEYIMLLMRERQLEMIKEEQLFNECFSPQSNARNLYNIKTDDNVGVIIIEDNYSQGVCERHIAYPDDPLAHYHTVPRESNGAIHVDSRPFFPSGISKIKPPKSTKK